MPKILDLDAVLGRLERDRSWTAYALADLEPGHREHASWFCAEDGSGLVLLYREFVTPIVFCIESSESLASILSEIDNSLMEPHSIASGLPGDREIVVGADTAPLIRSLFRITNERRMIRMFLDLTSFSPSAIEGTIPIGPDHIEKVLNLYGSETPEFFYARMLTQGTFFGFFEGNDLVAIAGTHIVSPHYGTAAIGNVYTRADRRGRGYARLTTGAVSQALLAAGISTIVLNVREDNAAAIRVYEQIGFRQYCRYCELSVGSDKVF